MLAAAGGHNNSLHFMKSQHSSSYSFESSPAFKKNVIVCVLARDLARHLFSFFTQKSQKKTLLKFYLLV